MADRTTNLSMPFILPSQAQKHVTHNESLQVLDALVQLAVEEEASTPPASAAAGARFIVSANATGTWAGHEGHVAAWQDGAWSFLRPNEGWLAWLIAAQKLKIFRASAWSDLTSNNETTSILGINTAADTHNRLAVASDASLFTHAGNSHQTKINKSAASDTATLLFQSNWTGHAEIGLAGNNDFSIKVSNGKDWLTALTISHNGTVNLPQRPTGRAYKNSGTVALTPDTDNGFTMLDQTQGGVVLGSPFSNGERPLIVPAQGLYLLSFMSTSVASSVYATSLFRNKTEALFSLWAPAAAPLTVSHSQIIPFAAGDELSLRHTGAAQIYNAAGATQLTIAML